MIIGLKIYWFAYNSKTTWPAQLKFVHNVGNYKWFMQIEFGGIWSRDQNVTGRKWAGKGRFWTIHLGKYRFWWKMICGLWAHYQPFFFWLCSFTPTWILFFFFFVFFLTFFFLLLLSTFKLLNSLYSKLGRLKTSGRTCAGMISGVPGWGSPPQTGPPKFKLFNLSS